MSKFPREGLNGATPGRGRIDLVQVNVSDQDYAGVSQGWEKHYWTPWREYLTRPHARGGRDRAAEPSRDQE